MTYEAYRYIQSRVESIYAFHPEFLEQLPAKDRLTLKEGTLYDVDDDDYPKSVHEYYKKAVVPDKKLQEGLLRSIKQLYQMSGYGEFDLEKELAEDVTHPQ